MGQNLEEGTGSSVIFLLKLLGIFFKFHVDNQA